MNDFEEINPVGTPAWSRRKFMASSVALLGAMSYSRANARAAGPFHESDTAPTVQEIIDAILGNIPNAPFKETVDTIKTGDPRQSVTGIVTTMFATVEVIKKTIEQRANFIIAHEPTFYNHLDETSWLESSNVYGFKRNLLRENKICVWRCHDYLHSFVPDGVRLGVMKAAGWDRYYDAANPSVFKLPPTTLGDLISHLKKTLAIDRVRFIGNPAQSCRRIALMPGAAGGRNQIQLLQREQPDVLLCGEVQEWETSEYIRDAQAMGVKTSLVVLGHAVSEEPGLEWLADWLSRRFFPLKIAHIPSHSPFTVA
jgi:putative NIF3 family GTP cyclohydrolase 1 type 2